ncbi:thiamine pyrophosphate-binding protein [Acuticoccus sediminis]|uniref:thiamine pyrophosphate-binding protein n=1 Tax=Acuticoccus sediminis TaxID=2184697 RepID=UPI001CFF3EDB|nr:thiamine pyrophosphate-binding protein [Acuticoccus sediminis]
MNEMSGAEAAVRMLQLHDVKHVFGLCGDTSLPFYDALCRLDHGMEHILTRDERSAAYMADAYARVTGKVGVCEGPSGGGATYILPGVVEANESSIPVLAITSDVPVTSRGKYPLTELDQKGLFRPLTKWNGVIDRPDQVPSTFRTAFRAMTTGRPGAAHIGLPYDIQKQAVSEDLVWAQAEHGSFPAWRSAPDPTAVEKAAECILSANAPVFIVGGGVVNSGAMEELSRLALMLNAPVCTTVTGQGALSSKHELCVGVVGTNGGVIATREVVEMADLVVFVGARAGSTTTEHWTYPSKGTRIVHIDADPMVVAANYPTEVALIGDAKLALANLADAIEAAGAPMRRDGLDGKAVTARAKAKRRAAFELLCNDDSMPIRPERLLNELQKVLPRDATIVADPGTPCPYLSGYYDFPEAGRYFLTNRAHGALGYAMSAAMGAWYGRPGSRTVAVMGDGSFGFTVGELETIVRKQIPLLMIVISNSVFGWIKASQKVGYGERYFSVDFSRTRHAAVAEAYGVTAFQVADPKDLAATFKKALAVDGPVLVDVISQPLQDTAVPVSAWMG